MINIVQIHLFNWTFSSRLNADVIVMFQMFLIKIPQNSQFILFELYFENYCFTFLYPAEEYIVADILRVFHDKNSTVLNCSLQFTGFPRHINKELVCL